MRESLNPPQTIKDQGRIKNLLQQLWIGIIEKREDLNSLGSRLLERILSGSKCTPTGDEGLALPRKRKVACQLGRGAPESLPRRGAAEHELVKP